MKPVRIQRKRTKGWRMPPNTVCVTRPGKYGNPYIVEHKDGVWGVSICGIWKPCPDIENPTRADAATWAVSLFRAFVLSSQDLAATLRRELRGKNLACFCAPDKPCHADVLLELANPDRE
jgi:hypothetical protein